MSSGIQEIGLEPRWGARIHQNNLVADPAPQDLDEDLVLVELPGDLWIDVGWFTEDFDSGHYVIWVIRGADWQNPIRCETAPTAVRAAEEVRKLVEEFANSSGSGSQTSESQTRMERKLRKA